MGISLFPFSVPRATCMYVRHSWCPVHIRRDSHLLDTDAFCWKSVTLWGLFLTRENAQSRLRAGCKCPKLSPNAGCGSWWRNISVSLRTGWVNSEVWSRLSPRVPQRMHTLWDFLPSSPSVWSTGTLILVSGFASGTIWPKIPGKGFYLKNFTCFSRNRTWVMVPCISRSESGYWHLSALRLWVKFFNPSKFRFACLKKMGSVITSR